jgi:hypothetical protein
LTAIENPVKIYVGERYRFTQGREDVLGFVRAVSAGSALALFEMALVRFDHIASRIKTRIIASCERL